MGITVICASVYMWYKKTEHFPFGMREVRPLLVARGLFGFFGVFGMYCKSFAGTVDSRLVLTVLDICCAHTTLEIWCTLTAYHLSYPAYCMC